MDKIFEMAWPHLGALGLVIFVLISLLSVACKIIIDDRKDIMKALEHCKQQNQAYAERIMAMHTELVERYKENGKINERLAITIAELKQVIDKCSK